MESSGYQDTRCESLQSFQCRHITEIIFTIIHRTPKECKIEFFATVVGMISDGSLKIIIFHGNDFLLEEEDLQTRNFAT